MATKALFIQLSLLCCALSLQQGADAFDDSALESPESICAHSGGGDGRGVLQSMQEKIRHMKGYSFDSDLTTYKGGKKVKETGKFYFKSPNLMRFEVIKAGSRSGAVVVKQADGRIRGHMGGAMSGFKFSLAPDSKLLKSANGFSILESDLASLISDAKHKADSRKCLTAPGSSQNPQIIELLETDGDVSDRIAVNPSERMPEVWNLFSDNKLLSVLKFENLQVRNDLPDSLFSMGTDIGQSKGLEDDFETMRWKIEKLVDNKATKSALTAELLKEVGHVIDALRQEISGINRSITDLKAVSDNKDWTGNTRVKLMVGAINLENMLSSLKPVSQVLRSQEKSNDLPADISDDWQQSVAECNSCAAKLIDDVESDHPDVQTIANNQTNLQQNLDRLEAARKRADESLSRAAAQ